jgi:hypothetical protein
MHIEVDSVDDAISGGTLKASVEQFGFFVSQEITTFQKKN